MRMSALLLLFMATACNGRVYQRPQHAAWAYHEFCKDKPANPVCQ
jgi:hypothetical protein